MATTTTVDHTIDDVDRQLLTLLQEDARYPAIELAEHVGVSDNTVHNRMERLEEAGIVGGYTTEINHRNAGLKLRFLFICTTRISDRAKVSQEALELPQVTDVTELRTGQRNIQIEAIGYEDEDITHVAQQLDDLNLEINDQVLVREEHTADVDYSEVEATLRD